VHEGVLAIGVYNLGGELHALEDRRSHDDGPSPTASSAPAQRYELIVDTCNALWAAAAFVVVDDHDPKPLWYQFDAEYAGAYSWDYLEQGGEVRRVRIGRPAA
jgi:uncharacterized protein (DUF2249 family)